MAEQAEKFPQNFQVTPIPFSLQMKGKDATISNDRLFCSIGNSSQNQVALGEDPMDAATKRKFSFQFNLQGNTNQIGIGVSKNTTPFTDSAALGYKEGECGIFNHQNWLGWIYHNGENAFPGWISLFKENEPVTMTLDTEMGELTIFDSQQVSLGTYQNDQFKNGVFYPACSVLFKDSKASIMKLTRILSSEEQNELAEQQLLKHSHQTDHKGKLKSKEDEVAMKKFI